MIKDRAEQLSRFHARHFAEDFRHGHASTNGHRNELTDEEVIELARGAKNAAKFEQAKLEFFGLEKRFVGCRLNFDFRNLCASGNDRLLELPEKKRMFVVWLRLGKSIRQFFF